MCVCRLLSVHLFFFGACHSLHSDCNSLQREALCPFCGIAIYKFIYMLVDLTSSSSLEAYYCMQKHILINWVQTGVWFPAGV